MSNKCENIGPNRTKCMRTKGHDGVHSSRTPVFGEYGRKQTDYNFLEWNDVGHIRPPEYGCSVPMKNFDNIKVIKGVINQVLLQDARNTLEEGKVIEIRAKLEKDGIAWYHLPSPNDCPDGFEKQHSMQQEPLFDFDGNMEEIKPFGYFLLARIKL